MPVWESESVVFLAVLAVLVVLVCGVLSLLGYVHAAGTVALWSAALILLIGISGGVPNRRS